MGTPDFNQTATKMKNFNQAIEAALADNTVIAVADALRDTKVTTTKIRLIMMPNNISGNSLLLMSLLLDSLFIKPLLLFLKI